MATSKDVLGTGETKETTTGDERSLKKAQAVAGTLRRSQLATLEMATGVADAFANGWKSFRDQVAEARTVLDGGALVGGSVEAAATFLEGVAAATRRSYEQWQTNVLSPAPTPGPAIDYERLAKLVAAEMRAA